jgi:hypothetical protein
MTSLSAAFTSTSTSPAIVPHPYWSLSLNPALVPFLEAFLPRVRWIYVPVLTFLLLQFCTRLWQLRTFLRASQPAAETLSFLFEVVRSDTNGPLIHQLDILHQYALLEPSPLPNTLGRAYWDP